MNPCRLADGTIIPGLDSGTTLCRSIQRQRLDKLAMTGKDVAPAFPPDPVPESGLPTVVTMQTDPCALSSRWKIHPQLASALVSMSAMLPFGFEVISGFRTVERQRQLMAEGRPAADPAVSTHTICPATGADLRVSVAPVDTVKAQLGSAAVFAGLRWGGGSPVNPGTGIPSDWNHVDLGPRR